MPAEWESHEATWLSWPKNPLTFPAETINEVEQIYVEMVSALSSGEKVRLLVDDEVTEKKVRSLLPSQKNVEFYKIRSADVWVRDYGPIFVRKKSIAATKWNFDAWGKKYDDLLGDNEVGMEIAKIASRKVFSPNIVLEGGSIDVNGAGMCLTTEECLLNSNRNPRFSKSEIESYLLDYLGVEHVIWLERGIVGDDTDGHVDDIARFVARNTVVCMVESDPADDNYKILKKNHELLLNYKDPSGERLNIIPIEMPKKVVVGEGRLPASYANFYIGNSVVLLPVFGDKKRDQKAITTLSNLFSERKVVPIECTALVGGFGGIHCVTQQQPALLYVQFKGR